MKETVKATRGRPSRKPAIIAATDELIRTRGLSSVTTRAIAEHVGCSEAAIYVHFDSRHELLLAVLEGSLPDMLAPLDLLEKSVGKSTPQQNLVKALRAIYSFQERMIPMHGSLFGEPELLLAYRTTFAGRRKGPQGGIGRLQRYITGEQALNRIPKEVDAEAAATALIAGSFFKAFMTLFFAEAGPTDDSFKKLVAGALRKS
jgi:AcrR family transcriptional regulator